MARTPRPSLGALALVVGLAVACTAEAPAPQKVTPDPVAAGETPAPAPEEAKAATPPPLTEEELALIAADPKDLTPEQRRKRAYARRKQIMQNPDSPTARALNDLAEAHQAGEIDVQRKDGVWLSAPGTKPTGGRPPAGWRPSDGQTQPVPATEPPPSAPAAPPSGTAP
jgi:hypothetical protein